MNGIEKITERIAVDTEQEATRLLADAKEQADRITANFAALADSDYRNALAQGKAQADDRVVRLEGVAQLEARKRRLAVKQELLGRAFDLALEKLLALPEEQYVSLLAKLATDSTSTGKEAIILSTADRPRYGKRVVLAANALLEQAGRPASLTLSEESRDFRGGLYLQAGNVETNCTFPTIVRMLREQMAGQVAQVLFD